MYIASKEGQAVFDVYESLVEALPEKGIPRYSISNESVLGLKRSDTDPNRPHAEVLASMRAEGALLGNEDVISLGEHKRLIVFNMTAASPHTVFRVPYQEFDIAWRTASKEKGIAIDTGIDVLIKGKDSNGIITPSSYVPLDMLVSVMLEEDYEENGEQKKRLLPVDFGDLCSSSSIEPTIDKFKLGLQEKLEKLEELFTAYYKRNMLNVQVILDLYNNTIRKGYAEDQTSPLFIPEFTAQDILQGVGNGYYRGDELKSLKQFDYDHLGKGTQSLTFLHARDIAHAEMDLLRRIAQINRISVEDVVSRLQRKPDYFGEGFAYERVMVDHADKTNKKVRPDLFSAIPITDVQKIFDSYSSVAHMVSEEWTEDQLKTEDYFQGFDIQSFNHHTTEKDEVRSSQGVQISISCAPDEQDEVAVQMLMKGSTFIGQVFYPLWEDVKRYTERKVIMNPQERQKELIRIKEKYNLPQKMIEPISALLPTERQLQNLFKTVDDPNHKWRINHTIERYNKKKRNLLQEKKALEAKVSAGDASPRDLTDLVYLSQYMQIYEDIDGEVVNKGYNVPGVPSFSLSYYYDESLQKYNLLIGWTLSMKGISEHVLGALLKRAEAKV